MSAQIPGTTSPLRLNFFMLAPTVFRWLLQFRKIYLPLVMSICTIRCKIMKLCILYAECFYCLWFLQCMSIISLHNIKWLVFLMDTNCVVCEVISDICVCVRVLWMKVGFQNANFRTVFYCLCNISPTDQSTTFNICFVRITFTQYAAFTEHNLCLI